MRDTEATQGLLTGVSSTYRARSTYFALGADRDWGHFKKEIDPIAPSYKDNPQLWTDSQFGL
ncbi:hypothetical protein GCM10011490_24480 [Pseudoclavibacter endophyticus]|nr:hypothetical protein GCM10011490_24480 [Pseudoclavibacter endophyticus]